nr:MAG TPA: hypothetical protein [Bacteriophage sp.]
MFNGIIHPVSVIFLYLKFENFTAIIKFSMMNQ